MNNDLISRSALKKAILKHCRSEIEAINHFWYDDTIISLIDNAPTVDLKDIYQEGHYDGQLEGYTRAINEERPQGEWNYIQANMCVCPSCGAMPHKLYKNFCAKCGAEMRGGAEE